jgi:hypothetical protein
MKALFAPLLVSLTACPAAQPFSAAWIADVSSLLSSGVALLAVSVAQTAGNVGSGGRFASPAPHALPPLLELELELELLLVLLLVLVVLLLELVVLLELELLLVLPLLELVVLLELVLLLELVELVELVLLLELVELELELVDDEGVSWM